MRTIITASLPEDIAQAMKKEAKKRHMSVSEFIRYLFALEQDCISEEELLKMAQQIRKEHGLGSTKKLNSLEELCT